MKNKKNKEEIYVRIAIGIGVLILVIVILSLIEITKSSCITYQYFKDGNKGLSKECYETKDQDLMCLINGNFVSVDQYYRWD